MHCYENVVKFRSIMVNLLSGQIPGLLGKPPFVRWSHIIQAFRIIIIVVVVIVILIIIISVIIIFNVISINSYISYIPLLYIPTYCYLVTIYCSMSDILRSIGPFGSLHSLLSPFLDDSQMR